MAVTVPTIRLIYGFFIVLAFILTLVALFTPGWRSYKGDGAPNFGVVTYDCGRGNRKVIDWDCTKWSQSKSPFEKITLGLLIVALIMELFALGCFIALLKTDLRLYMPAITFCAVAFICLFAALIVYGVRNEKKTAYMISQTYELIADNYLGYSFWIALLATLCALLATLAAGGVFSKTTETV